MPTVRLRYVLTGRFCRKRPKVDSSIAPKIYDVHMDPGERSMTLERTRYAVLAAHLAGYTVACLQIVDWMSIS